VHVLSSTSKTNVSQVYVFRNISAKIKKNIIWLQIHEFTVSLYLLESDPLSDLKIRETSVKKMCLILKIVRGIQTLRFTVLLQIFFP
jgi:hypothetical protein